jgi:hypothetical protein
MERSRITRELSDGLASGLASVTMASSAWGLSRKAVSLVGVGAATVPKGQGIYRADARRDAFLEGAREIAVARAEFLSHNGGASGTELTPNGVALYRRVKAIEHLVQNSLSGGLASIEDLQQAFASLSENGAVAP